MPARNISSKQAVASRRSLRVAQVVIFLTAGALAYVWSHPSSSPITPIAAAPIANEPEPVLDKHIYFETADAKADIAAALALAKREHKRAILDFGGDWCGDCLTLDYYFHQSENAELLEHNFVLVHVWIGNEQIDANLDIPEKYGVPIHKGVPALVVVDSDGQTVYAQQDGEFNTMRSMDSSSVTEFLNKWKS